MKQIVTITGENLNIVTNNVEDIAATGKKTKAQMRLEALKAAGVDVSKYFPLGDDQLIKIENGAAVPVDMDDATIDAVGKQIVEGGYVSNWKLFRRWVMSQMFHMLQDMDKNGRTFNEVLQHNGYEYQWRMLENELYAQMKMAAPTETTRMSARETDGSEALSLAIWLMTTSRSSASMWTTTLFGRSRKTRTERRRRHSSIPVRAILTYVFRTMISSSQTWKRRYMLLSVILRARCMTAIPTRKSTMPFTSSTRSASISHGTPSNQMLSSMPTKVLVPTTR